MRHTLLLPVSLSGFLIAFSNNSNAMPPDYSNAAIKETVDSIVIIKNKRQMELYNHQRLLKVYHVCLGPMPIGKKQFKNDGKTPEGIYYINSKNPYSHYHKCLGISYPSATDTRYANSLGRSTGGDIKIHGLPNGKGYMAKDFTKVDWTLGCIALTDDEIDQLYAHTSVGTCVNILP